MLKKKEEEDWRITVHSFSAIIEGDASVLNLYDRRSMTVGVLRQLLAAINVPVVEYRFREYFRWVVRLPIGQGIHQGSPVWPWGNGSRPEQKERGVILAQ
jgi:hypothetical protein